MNSAAGLIGQSERHGARPALVSGGETVSHAEFAERVRRSAGALRALGAQPGERVIFVMRDTAHFAAAWLGAVHAGAVAVALNSRLSGADYRHILEDSAARLAVVDDAFLAARPELASIAVSARQFEQEVARAPALAAHPVEAETAALWLYSSGTTGRPKGIVHAHRAIASVGGSFRSLGIAAGERTFTTSRLFFAYGLEHGLLAPLALGATSILCADWPDAGAVLEVLEQHRPVAMFAVPTLYRRLLAESAQRLAIAREVRRFVAGGERPSPKLVTEWRTATGGEMLNLYGMSETFCACVLTPPGSSDGTRTGTPLPGVEIRLADEHGHEPAAGEPGVLWVRHPAQTRAYANLPERTRELFRDGWFRSGDMFIRDAEGYLVHQGRSDELVKIAGQWVHPGEIEEVAARSAGVAEAACLPMADADGLERLALFVAANGEEAARAAAEACERLLPRHKRPKWVRAVAELPRTATGKVQRYKLREWLARELAGTD